MSEKEIFKTMTNGTTKNRSSHRYGSATTRPRPEMPNRRRYEVVFIESAGHDHRARRIPRQIHLLVPRNGLGMARRIRLGYAYDLAGGQLHQVDRQISQIGNVLHRAPHYVVAAFRLCRRHEHFFRPDGGPHDGLRRRTDAMAD